MNNIESQYKDVAVRVLYNGKYGSGCLYTPPNSKFSYIFTAKHCIISDEEDINSICVDNILLYRYNDKSDKNKLKILAYEVDPDLDLILFQIERVASFSLKIDCPLKGVPIQIYGYPNKLKEQKEPRENVICTVSFRHEKYFEIELSNVQFTFDSSTNENIKGLSGSGVFKEINDSVILVGLFTRLKASDGRYNKLCAFNTNSLLKLLSKFESIQDTDDFSKMKKDAELHQKVFYLPYTIDSEPYYLNRQIDGYLNNCIVTNKNIWISGESGCGKTNLVQRNLSLKSTRFISFDLSGHPENVADYYFDYIYNELVNNNICIPKTDINILEHIAKGLAEHSNEFENLILFVDEVPIYNEDSFFVFISNFIIISERYCALLKNKKTIKWVVSTRINPEPHLCKGNGRLTDKSKANKNFNFKNIGLWSENDLNQLLIILEKTLQFNLSSQTRANIIEASNGKAGRLKDIIERMILEDCSIDMAIELIKLENN